MSSDFWGLYNKKNETFTIRRSQQDEMFKFSVVKCFSIQIYMYFIFICIFYVYRCPL